MRNHRQPVNSTYAAEGSAEYARLLRLSDAAFSAEIAAHHAAMTRKLAKLEKREAQRRKDFRRDVEGAVRLALANRTRESKPFRLPWVSDRSNRIECAKAQGALWDEMRKHPAGRFAALMHNQHGRWPTLAQLMQDLEPEDKGSAEYANSLPTVAVLIERIKDLEER